MIVDTLKSLRLEADGIELWLHSMWWPSQRSMRGVSGGCVTLDIPEPPGYVSQPKDLPVVKMADGRCDNRSCYKGRSNAVD